MASTGVLMTACTPQITTPSHSRMTMKRLRIENSMIFSIMIYFPSSFFNIPSGSSFALPMQPLQQR